MLSGQHASQQPHGRGGISGVESAKGVPQAVKATAIQPQQGRFRVIGIHRLDSLKADAQPLQAFERAPAIRGGGKIGDFGAAFGQRGKNRIAMRDGLVTGEFEGSADGAA
jgi:hypothetical protein